MKKALLSCICSHRVIPRLALVIPRLDRGIHNTLSELARKTRLDSGFRHNGGRVVILSFILFFVLAITGCAKQHPSWSQEMRAKIQKYSSYSKKHLEPYFKRAKVPYPPKKLAFLIFKRSRQFQLWAKNSGRWTYIRTFRILAASGGPGPKLHTGDDQVPEGIYQIIGLNPDSRFDLSMHLNYPNAFDRKYAKLDHRTNLGSNIFIHGDKRSVGCVAIGDYAIEQLFPLVYAVGRGNVTVIIAPNNLRVQRPVYGKVRPSWLPILYQKITKALAPFVR